MSIYQQWLEASSALKPLKLLEMTLRKEIVFKFLTPSDKPESVTMEEDGYKIVAKTGVIAALDKSAVKEHWRSLSAEDQKAIRWTPSLVPKEYNELPMTSLLRTFVTKKPGAPSLAITETSHE